MALPLIVMCASSLLHAEDLIHILKRGETLYGISRQYNVPADAIMEYNNLDNPDRLREGQKIRIPGVYTVARGDTLYGIARRFSIPVEELLSANKLARNSTIRIGDVLYLPGKSSGDSKPDNPVVVTAAPTVPLEDPRTYKTGKLDSTVIWPVEASEIAYLSGKLYGVSITADRNSEVRHGSFNRSVPRLWSSGVHTVKERLHICVRRFVTDECTLRGKNFLWRFAWNTRRRFPVGETATVLYGVQQGQAG